MENVGPQHVVHLQETAEEELRSGFLEGLFFGSEAELDEYFGHRHWAVVRRFVLVQGAEMKLRPIDDCLEAQLNQAFASASQASGRRLRHQFGAQDCRSSFEWSTKAWFREVAW